MPGMKRKERAIVPEKGKKPKESSKPEEPASVNSSAKLAEKNGSATKSNPPPRKMLAMRRKNQGKESENVKTPKVTPKPEESTAVNGNGAHSTPAKDNSTEPTQPPRKLPKRGAACSDFKEKSVKLATDRKSTSGNTKPGVVEEETDAILHTKLDGPEADPLPCRKILDFILHDSDGNSRLFEMSEIDDTYITALVMPMDDDLEKEKERGVRCEGFGRIESWSISGYDEGMPVIWVSTEIASYECVKPGATYKKFFEMFQEKAHICIAVFKILARSRGGNPDMSLEDLLAKVVRAMSGSKTFPAGTAGIDYVISLGEFIYNQLAGLDEDPEQGDASFTSLPVLLALKEQCEKRSRTPAAGSIPSCSSGSIKIKEVERSSSPPEEDEDEKLARLLQEEEDWKAMKQRNRNSSAVTQNKFYIKINEDEIANDYPLPAYYKPTVLETDEYILTDTDSSARYSDDLPTRVLNNWSLYNNDSRLISLELIPMKPCAETDVTIFGSGYMKADDGSGYYIDVDPGQSSSASGSSNGAVADGIPVYLSAIKEWMIEFGSSMIFLSVRTDMAWYRLGKPTKQYAAWYEPILKTARLAISIISLLKGQSRASKLSFSDVIKKVSEYDKECPTFISSNIASVERYIVVHGQIIVQLFADYPDETIRRCAFIVGLLDKMEQRHHTKLVVRKKVALQKEVNMNPSATMEIQSKRTAMRATTTKLINRIWGGYYSNGSPEDPKGDANETKEEVEEVEEQEENDDDDVEEEATVMQDNSQARTSTTRSQKSKAGGKGITWKGASVGTTKSGETLYKSALVRGELVSVGGCVTADVDDLEDRDVIYMEYMFQKADGSKMAHGRLLKKGYCTVLGNAANERELFLTSDCVDFELEDVKEQVTVDFRKIKWGHQHRKEQIAAAKNDRSKAEERKMKGLPTEYFCKSLYCPETGAFCSLPHASLGLGTGVCNSCNTRENATDEFKIISSRSSFIYNKTEYHVNDFVYVTPNHFGEVRDDNEKFKSGRNIGLKAFSVCRLLEIETPKNCKEPAPDATMVKVRRFYRPEDVSAEKAYGSDIREIYYSDEVCSLPVEALEGKCEVLKKCDLPGADLPVKQHMFFCERLYDGKKGSFKQLPADFKIPSPTQKSVNGTAKKNKGKGKIGEEDSIKWNDVPPECRLATLDIFAGCGGLSEGLHQSGACFTKWAIEYEQPAGDAFSLNHPEAVVFVDNCNVILRAIMEKCGDAADCIATSEATELASSLSEEKVKNLPVPGQVEFISGGPPCQGFSGMNRFNQGTWSKVQCEMILAFLSYADYFRPRFFLLENVRTFVSFNKGQTFRLTLASLLEMGYQVRFGILEAGAFGVSQSRKRAFIWAASPEETLPEWPEPMHVFASPELKIPLPGGMHYAAAPSTAGGAPFRSITVRDTIGDLPAVGNGASKLEMEYGVEPISWFQKQIRGNTMLLSDHISKEMNELNLIRCQHIPRKPGCDWRDLPDKKVKLSTGQMVELIPWCLPNTAKRHNQWKGLFGRLDWEGNFPTSITDPQPMGKVGMCFHPEQDRILTVRECARSQGFPDSYRFSGNIQNKHRQIGNAVPPPLAFALGRKLKEAVDAKQ